MKHRAWLASGLAFAFLGLTGCSHKKNPPLPLPGAGSLFVYPVMQRWTMDYTQIFKDVNVTYQPIGDQKALALLAEGKVDFAAIDTPLPMSELTAKKLLELPETAGPVCIIYNFPDAQRTDDDHPLRLSAQTLAAILTGKITQWNDPAIIKENPGLKLPDHAIELYHRSDPSSSTDLLSQYLAAAAPDWKSAMGTGTLLKWTTGTGSSGSEGVAASVRNTPYSLGYVELTYAQESYLPMASLENAAGDYIRPSEASATATLDALRAELSRDVATRVVNPPASAPQAYPIVGVNYLILQQDRPDPTLQRHLRKFAEYVLHNGQDTAYELHYARLTPAMVRDDEHQLTTLTSNGKPVL